MSSQVASKIELLKKQWLETNLLPQLKKNPERKAKFTTSSDDLEVAPVYVPEEGEAEGYLQKLGFPGEYPFTRGIYASMYRGRSWSQRQLVGLGVPEDVPLASLGGGDSVGQRGA